MQPNVSDLDTQQLPRAVVRQMERVSERLRERAEARTAAGAPPPAEPDGAPAALTNDADTAPQSAASPAPPLAAPAAESRENDPTYWRDRFRLMQGINDKLRQDHADAMADRDQRLGELTQRMRDMEQQAAARPAGGSDKIDLNLFFTPDQIERFGEDQCEAMAHAAVKAAGQQAQQIIDAEVKPLKDAAKDAQDRKVQDAESAFWTRLSQLVPEFDEINAEQGWLAWLRELGDDGEPRQARLDRYRSTRNAQGVATVFRDYSKTKLPANQPPVAARGAGNGGGGDAPTANVAGKGYPSREEIREYTKRRATIRNPRDPRYVTDKDVAEFEARLRLQRPYG
jgi:hypothetical protein